MSNLFWLSDEQLASIEAAIPKTRRSAGRLISEKQARSIKYQITIAKLPLAKDVDDFAFADTPINETLVRDLTAGASA